MSKRSKTTAAPHTRKHRSAAPRSKPGSHAGTGEQAVDHSLEESFPASDPPAHGKDKPVDDTDDAIDRGED